jgi:diguanylate cyclase (GGDEF)-like protein
MLEKKLTLTDDKLYEYAFMDSTTGLNNKNYITEILPKVMANRNVDNYSVILLDVDYFKYINDTWGYQFGNKVLNEIGKRLTNNSINESIVSYSGADRFLIILFESLAIKSFVVNILETLRQDFIVENHKFNLTISIGIYVNENNGNVYEALQNADIALNSAKEKGRNCAVYYDESLKQTISRKLHIVEKLRSALDNNILNVYYQPQIRLTDEKTIGFEALLRWMDEDYGYISPSEFIPLAEETEIILQLGRYVIEKVCKQIKNWSNCGIKNITVSINLSTEQFKDTSLTSYIFGLLEFYGLSPDILEFEVTETALVKDIEHSDKMLSYFQQKGIKIAIDDFGTGFSSYKYLSKMNFNTIKIDKTFIDSINTDSKKSLIVKNIIDLAHIIGSEVVAEGAEEEEQVTVLKKHGCDVIQGFYYSKPMPIKELEVYIKKLNF